MTFGQFFAILYPSSLKGSHAMLQEKAKTNIRRLRVLSILTTGPVLLLLAIVLYLLVTDILTTVQSCLIYVVLGLYELFGARVIMARAWKKYVYNVMDEDLDAPLFVEILHKVGKYDPFAIHQLQLLYAEGRHADVVSLCAKQMDNPYAKRSKPGYLTYMAFAYFSLGDDQKLAEIHEATEWFLQSQKKPETYRRLMPMQVFYAAYLKRDTDACEAYFTANPPKVRIAAIQRYLMKARVAQLKGDTEEAERYLHQVLTEAPNAPAAVTAKAHLAAIERGEGYDKAYPEALPDPLFPVVTSEKRHKLSAILMWVCMIAAAALLVYTLVLDGIIERKDNGFREDVRVAMEAEHDGVTVHEYLALMDGEAVLDALAICSTDEGVVVAALYGHEDDPDKLFCHTLVIFTEEELAGSLLPSHVFLGYTTEYLGVCAFYEAEADIPADAVAGIPVTVYGRELWFAVTDVRT